MSNRYSIEKDGITRDQYGREFSLQEFSRRKRGRPRKNEIVNKNTVRNFERGRNRTAYVDLKEH
jgi:hypothetical protein